MSSSGGFEDHVAKYERGQDAKARQLAAQEAERLRSYERGAADLQAGLTDVVEYLRKRSPAEQIRVGRGKTRFTHRKSAPGWVIAYSWDSRYKSFQRLEILCPDNRVWVWHPMYEPRYDDPVSVVSRVGSVSIAWTRFETVDGELMTKISTTDDLYHYASYRDGLAEIARNAENTREKG